MQAFHGTTILSVRNDRQVAVGGDGQVSLGDTVMKGNAIKVRKLYHDRVIAGFAGSTADAFTLFEKFEAALEKYHGQLARSAVELAKEWRSDRALRKLEAMLIVADATATLLVSGNGDVIEPEAGVLAIGSGGNTPEPPPQPWRKTPTSIPKTSCAKLWPLPATSVCIQTTH